MSSTDFHLQESPSDLSPKVKSHPSKSLLPIPFAYFPSDDGTDHNILILLHGLGDSHVPFGKLGRSLKLPQTAVLALRATEQIPFFDEPAFQWYTSFDQLGEMIDRPNPRPALELLDKVVHHLVSDLQWSQENIHFFGFAQGGSVAAEFALKKWREHIEASASEPNAIQRSFGSLVTVGGPLLSYPTLSVLSPTPVLVASRPPPAQDAMASNSMAAFRKGFQNVGEVKLSSNRSGMPASREEWEPIMRFWSERLSKRKMDDLYEVMSGMGS